MRRRRGGRAIGAIGAAWIGAALAAGCGPSEATVVPPPACGGGCGDHEVCDVETNSCACAPGFVDDGAACVSGGSMGGRTRAEVCARWTAGHQATTPSVFEPGPGQCALGAVPSGAVDDALARLAMFRWLSGLDTAVTHDAAYDADAQACSVIAGWWDFGRPESPHTPSNTATCWSLEGARGAGSSNIAWGISSPADAITGFMEDSGANNVSSLGHRRWLLNPPLGPIGVGYWSGGGRFGNASCVRVHATRAGVRAPEWNAVPPPGYAPVEMTRWTWSIQGSSVGLAQASIEMERNGTPLPVEVRRLDPGYGEPSVSWVPMGWAPTLNVAHKVRVVGAGTSGVIEYEVTPVDCR